MNLPEPLQQADISPLGEQFTHFCRELDAEADDLALITAAVIADRNTHGDTCLELETLSGRPLLRSREGEILIEAPDRVRWIEALDCDFVGRTKEYRPLILDGHRLYLHRHWREEVMVAEGLRSRFQRTEHQPSRLKARLGAFFTSASADQRAGTEGKKLAAAMALTRRLTIITGGPGTGKTTTVTRILALLLEQEPEMRILLTAPTGKAAARLSESISDQTVKLQESVASDILERLPRESSTIHRLLGWRPEGFEYHAENPLPCDCLLLDETSMVDLGLMARLIDALPSHCRLILLGDRDQLSSVEAGSVLGDLTGNGRRPGFSHRRAGELTPLMEEIHPGRIAGDPPAIADHIIQLDYSYRFAAGGGIGRLARAVNEGDSASVSALMEVPDPELGWLEAAGRQPGERVIDWAMQRYYPVFTAANAADALSAFESARLLTALREGPWGETGLQVRIEERLRREGLASKKTGTPFQGMPLIIRRNDRETGLFNGDTGIFWSDDEGRLMAWFRTGEELKPFSLHLLPEWHPAWVLTVHRSQGSEYDHVLLVLPPKESPIVTKELIYTGITRARRHCTIVCDKARLFASIARRAERSSGLSERIGWPAPDPDEP